jgi:hypothetical protein
VHDLLLGRLNKEVISGRTIWRMPGRDKKCVRNFGWKSEGKRLLERLRYGRQDNIKMGLKETG